MEVLPREAGDSADPSIRTGGSAARPLPRREGARGWAGSPGWVSPGLSRIPSPDAQGKATPPNQPDTGVPLDMFSIFL